MSLFSADARPAYFLDGSVGLVSRGTAGALPRRSLSCCSAVPALDALDARNGSWRIPHRRTRPVIRGASFLPLHFCYYVPRLPCPLHARKYVPIPPDCISLPVSDSRVRPSEFSRTSFFTLQIFSVYRLSDSSIDPSYWLTLFVSSCRINLTRIRGCSDTQILIDTR